MKKSPSSVNDSNAIKQTRDSINDIWGIETHIKKIGQ